MSSGLELLRLSEVAEILGVSRSTIYNWVGEGRLPVVRHGRRGRRVPRPALDAYVAAQTKTAIGNWTER